MIKVWTATGLEKIRSDSMEPGGSTEAPAAAMSVARGEVEAAQICLRADDGPVDITGVKVEPIARWV